MIANDLSFQTLFLLYEGPCGRCLTAEHRGENSMVDLFKKIDEALESSENQYKTEMLPIHLGIVNR